MDPFSITAGAIGITDVASRSILELRNLIENLSETEDVIAKVNSSLVNIERPLSALQQLSISDETTSIALKEDLKKAGVAEAVNSCGDACKKFNENLTKWTKHSSTTKLSLKDRFALGVWNKEKIRTFQTHLQYCEATVHFAATSAPLLVQLRSGKMFEANYEGVTNQLQTLETKIQEHLNVIERQQEDVQRRKLELEEEPDDEEDSAHRLLAIQEVEKQSRLLEADQVSSGVIFSQIQSKRSGQDISNVITSEDSKAFVGMPTSVVGKINQRISGVRTEGGSTAHVGVFQDVFL